MVLEDTLLTEAHHPESSSIDRMGAREIVGLMNAEDGKVVAAVRTVLDDVSKAVEWAAERFRRGGRLIYVGAGTSGRLGVLDASECPPTFGTPPEMVVGVIAGGRNALTTSIEGAEDRAEQGAADLRALGIGPNDLVVGIAMSGRTPYVLGAVDYARSVGAATVGLACNKPSLLGEHVDLEIAPLVGPEVLAGSTRLKAGTATKMVLNMITTGSMVLLGKSYGNRMVDMRPLNEKLRLRTLRILRELGGVDDERARALLGQSGGHLKPALVMALLGVGASEAEDLLKTHGGRIPAIIDAIRGGAAR